MRFKKIIPALASVAVVTVALAIISKSGDNVVTNVLNTVSTPFQSAFAAIVKPINERIVFYKEAKGYKEENERLIKEITEIKIENRDIKSYSEENKRLKNLLDLQGNNANMTTVAASAVSKDYEKWYKGITINKGKNAGIKKGDPVITADGILGMVNEVGANWARVTTIFDAESAVGARFTRTGDIGVVEGDLELSEEGKCKIEYISGTASIMSGDILVSSGVGELYPEGLMIGTVSDVKVDAMGKIEYAVVEPSVDFDNIYEVLVVTGFSTNTENNNGE